MPRLVAVFVVLVGSVVTACAESHCRFGSSSTPIRISEYLSAVFQLEVLKRDGQPELLIGLARGHGENSDAFEFVRVGSSTRAIGLVALQHKSGERWPPAGYTQFVGGDPDSLEHSLIRGKFSMQHLGKASKILLLAATETAIVFDSESLFTGTRRILYGTVPLVEQDFVRRRELGESLDDFIAVEPDGDRIVCLCNDGRGAWIAIFSRKKLESQQPRRTP